MSISLLALLTGCSQGTPAATPPSSSTATSSEAPIPTPSVTPSPTPSPTPTAWSKEEAGQQYLAIVEPWNANVARWNAASDAQDTATLRAIAAENATLLRTCTDQLVAGKWPEEVKATVAKLISEWSADTPVWSAVAASKTDADLNAELAKLQAQSSAQEMRVLLGIDSVPVNG